MGVVLFTTCCSGHLQVAPEIADDDPHHGHAPQGAAAMHRALARHQGAAADALISRWSFTSQVIVSAKHAEVY